MLKKIAAIAVVIVIAVLSVILYFKLGGSEDLMSVLPEPKEDEMYLLVRTEKGGCSEELAALVAEGFSSLLEEGTPSHAIIFASTAAEEAALLAGNIRQSGVDICAALRFSSSDTDKLKDGKLPEILAPFLINAKIRQSSDEDIFAVEADGLSIPVYYFVKGKFTGFAADLDTMRRMMQAADGNTESLSGKRWEVEPSWADHAEYCDGGAITTNAQVKFPITIQAAWRGLKKEKAEDPAGEVKWQTVNLDSTVESELSDIFKAEKWETSKCVLPQPLLLSAGINVPKFDTKPDKWPFPLSVISGIASQLSMTDEEKNEAVNGHTVISLGGRSKILWFMLPGFTVQLNGRPELMRATVNSFWKDVFAGTEVSPISGFDCGGTANVPFSVVGAAKGDTSIMGLVSPETMGGGEILDRYLGKETTAVGWIFADMPRIGSALADMTKMSDIFDNDLINDGIDYGDSEEESSEPEQDIKKSASPFEDEAAAETFSELAKRMGKIFIIWEKPTSGSLCWYSTATDKK